MYTVEMAQRWKKVPVKYCFCQPKYSSITSRQCYNIHNMRCNIYPLHIRTKNENRFLLYPQHNEVGRGYIGFNPSVCLSIRPSVHLSCILCPLCSSYSSGWIHFIFIHLIKQLQKVCHVQCFLQNFTIWIFGNFLKFVTLTLCCFDLGSDLNH